MNLTKIKKEGGRGEAGIDGVPSESIGNAMSAAHEKNDGGGAHSALPEVRVKVRQHVPNKRIIIVSEPDGTLAKMRVRDSAHYRHGELIMARVQRDQFYEPSLHRSRPLIGGLVG